MYFLSKNVIGNRPIIRTLENKYHLLAKFNVATHRKELGREDLSPMSLTRWKWIQSHAR